MSVKYDNLLGREFIFGKQDCYSLVRDFYKQNFDIDLPNYARPNLFWKDGMDMYRDRYIKNGFEALHCHPTEYQIGDIFLMAIDSEVGNHAAILVENGQVLHHLWGRVSLVEPYRSFLRNCTMAVFRHKDVVNPQLETTASLLDYVSPHVRRKLNDFIQDNRLPFEQV